MLKAGTHTFTSHFQAPALAKHVFASKTGTQYRNTAQCRAPMAATHASLSTHVECMRSEGLMPLTLPALSPCPAQASA